MTENHNLSTPDKGTEDWDQPLNDNFEALDTAVEIRAPKADMSRYQPKQNALFVATDTNELYLGDGTQWQKWGEIPTEELHFHIGATEPTNYETPMVWFKTE